MVINHLLTRMILRVDNLKQPTRPHGFVPHQPLVFRVVFVGKLIVQKLPRGTLIRFLQALLRRGCHGGHPESWRNGTYKAMDNFDNFQPFFGKNRCFITMKFFFRFLVSTTSSANPIQQLAVIFSSNKKLATIFLFKADTKLHLMEFHNSCWQFNPSKAVGSTPHPITVTKVKVYI